MSSERGGSGKEIEAVEWHDPAEQDPLVRAALMDFRQSVSAWGDASFRQPRTVAVGDGRRDTAARSVAWSSGFVVLGCLVIGGTYERHREQVHLQAVRHEQQLQQQRDAAERAHEAEDLLARIDSDISRQVPSALDPLASLMTDEQE